MSTMNLSEIREQRELFALHMNEAASGPSSGLLRGMSTLPWPQPGQSICHIIDVPTWVWDDVTSQFNPRLITEYTQVTLRSCPDFGIIMLSTGEVIGKY